MSDSPEKIDQLVMVVHGVGDPAPGETISKLARSIATESQPLTETQQVLWLAEPGSDENNVMTFPSHVRNLHFETANVQLAEIFWGDLSRVRQGALGVVTGVLEILFGLIFVSYVAAEQPSRPAQLLKRVGLATTRLVHGPVLAVCFMLALLTFAIAGTEMMWSDSHKSQLWTVILLSSCCGATFCASYFGFRMTSNRVAKRFWFWTDVVAMFICGLMLIKIFLLGPVLYQASGGREVMAGLLWYCNVLVVMLGLLWFVETCLIVVAAGAWLAACLNPRTYKPALHVAFLLPAFVVGFWGLALPIAWLAAARSLRRFVELKAFEDIFHEAVPMMGVQVVMGSAVMITTIFCLMSYTRWRNLHVDFEPGQPVPKAPRIVVPRRVQVALAVTTLIGVLLVGFLGVMQLSGRAYEETMLGNVMAESNKYAIGMLLPTAFLLFLILPHLRPLFDIILDVVNHFHFRDTHLQDLLNDEDEFDISETTFDSGRLFFYQRDAIHIRFKTALTHFRDRLDNRPALTIISHSQGTMVAIEALNDPELAWINNAFSSVTLVTMGSPFTHLYQHYFGHFYPSLDSNYWRVVNELVDRWINIHRIDDYVGTQINFPTKSRIPTDQHPDGVWSNHAVGPRGHMNYWADAEVLEVLRDELMERYADDESDFGFHQSAA